MREVVTRSANDSLTDRLSELVRACFTGIWIESAEHADAMREIAELCRQESWRLARWDIASGWSGGEGQSETVGDPLSALRMLDRLSAAEGATLLVLPNFHRFLGSIEIVQTLAHQLTLGKQRRMIVVILAPTVQIPIELERQFVVVEHARPDPEQLADIARALVDGEDLPVGAEWERVLDAAAGLTREEAENALSLSLIRHDRLVPAAIWEQKTQMLKKSGLLTLYRGGQDFASLGGLAALKDFTRRLLAPSDRNVDRPRPRGVLLLSPPGCGKSAFCKALGREVGRPVLILDVGSLMGSLVGQTEERTRQALAIIDAMAPCVVMIDEVEKAFAGSGGAGATDSGVSTRMFGTLLTWLNDHESDVFVVCTANDVAKLPAEFARAERFDAVYFLDLPGRAEKDAIWNLYRSQFSIPADQPRPDDANWTGAEIRACCRLATLLDQTLTEAAVNIVPVAVTAGETVQRLRSWASGRCLDADRPGVYRAAGRSSAKRRPLADPSVN